MGSLDCGTMKRQQEESKESYLHLWMLAFSEEKWLEMNAAGGLEQALSQG